MQKIIPHLWFDTEAEEAATLYMSIFNGGKIKSSTRYGEAGFEVHNMKAGTVMTIEFEIEGLTFIGLNAGPVFKFTPAISFMVNCKIKEEVDELWNKLIEGGTALMPLDKYPFSERYGWVKDKYGEHLQIGVFSDSGIVYIPDKPYLISVMVQTKGGDVTAEERQKVTKFMEDISRASYDFFSTAKNTYK
ncbi:MAG TPA: VOC family protein [Candidatus Paceibacterota bacterium]|nr:VOC family protein [Candidatus Paceibacterota bacterium]